MGLGTSVDYQELRDACNDAYNAGIVLVAALVLKTSPGSYDLNTDGKWNPEEVRKKLQDTAIDLGPSGKDNSYGYGLVYALSAVQ